MKNILLLLVFSTLLNAQVKFDDYFLDKTLRLDYFHSGNYETESFSLDELIEEPYWAGSKINLIDEFNYGKCMLKVFDIETETLIYSIGYSTLFIEWQTTAEAKEIYRTYVESIVMPFPKKSVRVEIHRRDEKNEFIKKFEYNVNPERYFITKERKQEFPNWKIYYSGEPSVKLDIVFLPEGYTEKEMKDFKLDCSRFAEYLFNYSPFKENKDKINLWGVTAVSEESGSDIPGDTVWKRTIMNSKFYTFDTERYLMTNDYKSVRNVASNAPYEQIVILVNTDKYGGGAIYNFYATFSAKNEYAEQVFIHEFGHSFGGLADEYYTSEVAYQDFYPLDVEPWEPNITTLVDFESKWKDMLDEDVPIPTPEEEKYFDKLGVFEGAGYIAKDVYRPSYNSIMKSLSANGYNKVSRRAMESIIKYYTTEPESILHN